MPAVCMECGKEAENGLDLCPRCEGMHLIVDLRFDDFWGSLTFNPNPKRDPHEFDSAVIHLTQEEAGIVTPHWIDERIRMLRHCNMSYPKCLSDYIYLIHQICIDKYIRFGNIGFWNALIIVTSFFEKDWCVKRYYDEGRDEDKKKKISARSRGWKTAIFNPFDYMEWAMLGFKEWIIRWRDLGISRKQLVMKAEEIIEEATSNENP